MRPPGIAIVLGLLALLLSGCRSVAVVDPVRIDDARTAARVKTALVNDEQLGVRAIEVTVTNGVARLTGRVRDQAESERAVTLARSVPGVTSVESALRLGAEPAPPSDVPLAPGGLSGELDVLDLESEPRLLAVGVSFGWSSPTSDLLGSRTKIGPLIRIGSGGGLGVSIGFDWFQADVATSATDRTSLARVHVRPIMAGLAYTFGNERVSVSPGVVGGFAINSLSITESGTASGPLAVDVDNSVVLRPGVSVWIDANRRFALNLSAGYLLTRLDLTVLDNGRLSERDVTGDTLVLRAGLAYKLF